MGQTVLAFDFGASSGRAMLGRFDGDNIVIEEIHRFSNDPVMVNDTLYWDVLRLFYEIKVALIKAKQFSKVDSIAIDTWGVDFGLLDETGHLLENPIHYRDGRTRGMLDLGLTKLGKTRFYQITGNQFMEINTAFQLLALAEKRPKLLKHSRSMLMMPDLLNYFLTGIRCNEYSIASTSQLLDVRSKNWSSTVFEHLGIPARICEPIITPGTVLGKLKTEIQMETGLKDTKVIAVASHDTASAVAAVPAREKDFIYISCGTWSLVGTELDEPILNLTAAAADLTNEGGFAGKILFLKNITGLWLIQESCRQWQHEGKTFNFAELEKAARESTPFNYLIDPDAPMFAAPGDQPGRIKTYCQQTGQDEPRTIGEIVRCIYESLALKYRYALEQIKQCTAKEYRTIHIVGGGARAQLLCQMTADACELKVIAGPVEATVLGNIAGQLIATGQIDNLATARELIARSEPMNVYIPSETAIWRSAYEKFQKILRSEKE